MKGLLIKDLRLASQRKRYFMSLAVIAAILAFTTEGAFFVTWLIMIFGLFSLSSVAYDEYDNCYPFLMTLPITVKTYVKAKYVYSMLCLGAGAVLSLVIGIAAAMINGMPLFSEDLLDAVVASVVIIMLVIDLNMPLTLKYGSERGRNVLMALCGAVAAVIFLAVKVLPEDILKPMLNAEVPSGMLALTGTVLVILCTVISFAVSVRIIAKKEF